ncbi:MAG: hypothetical protein ACREH8_10110 [Opitutaceae bacterium]
MRLLSFLSAIERALVAGPNGTAGGAWETSRMMNFQHGLARLTIKPLANSEQATTGGTIFLQTFALPDGTLCLKGSLGWNGSDAIPVIAVYSTPGLNWRIEAARIAEAWLKGPPMHSMAPNREELAPLVAAAG